MLNEYEIEVLRMFNGEIEIPWGAWVGACIESLQGMGYITRGMTITITDKGKEYLEGYNVGN